MYLTFNNQGEKVYILNKNIICLLSYLLKLYLRVEN